MPEGLPAEPQAKLAADEQEDARRRVIAMYESLVACAALSPEHARSLRERLEKRGVRQSSVRKIVDRAAMPKSSRTSTITPPAADGGNLGAKAKAATKSNDSCSARGSSGPETSFAGGSTSTSTAGKASHHAAAQSALTDASRPQDSRTPAAARRTAAAARRTPAAAASRPAAARPAASGAASFACGAAAAPLSSASLPLPEADPRAKEVVTVTARKSKDAAARRDAAGGNGAGVDERPASPPPRQLPQHDRAGGNEDGREARAVPSGRSMPVARRLKPRQARVEAAAATAKAVPPAPAPPTHETHRQMLVERARRKAASPRGGGEGGREGGARATGGGRVDPAAHTKARRSKPPPASSRAKKSAKPPPPARTIRVTIDGRELAFEAVGCSGATSTYYVFPAPPAEPRLFAKVVRIDLARRYDCVRREQWVYELLRGQGVTPELVHVDAERHLLVTRHAGSPATRFSEDMVAQLRRILDVLDAHEVRHNDLKAPEILVDARGRVTLCDFGFSRVRGSYGGAERGLREPPANFKTFVSHLDNRQAVQRVVRREFPARG